MKKALTRLGKKGFEFLTSISPILSAKALYLMRIHKLPDLKNPTNFTEKLTWIKMNMYANNSLISSLADKYEVRSYVESKGYGDILNELYGLYDNPEDINFDELPKKFALKGTHGCAYNIICNDKEELDIDMAVKEANKWLREKYGYATTELHYTAIQPRLIIEKNISDAKGDVPTDYKFLCFNGEPKLIQVITERSQGYKLNYFDLDWNELDYGKPKYRNVRPVVKPKNLSRMISIARDLAADFPFVRVDLYNDEGEIIFGELTFTPACSCPPYFSDKGLVEMGRLLDLAPNASKKLDIQVLVSTMNQEDPRSLAGDMAINNYVIVNQITKKEIVMPEDTESGGQKILSFRDKGLSKSRNIAIKNSDADICVIADDDMYYAGDYEKVISDAYFRYPDADIIALEVDYDDSSKNKKPLNEGRVGLFYSMKISSVRITFRRSSIADSGVLFDERFGAGTDNFMGEENIFLADCIRAGLKVYSVPVKIATLRESESTWFKGFNKQFFIIKGKVYNRISPILAIPLIIRFALVKRAIFQGEVHPTKALWYMMEGFSKELIRNKKQARDEN